MIDVKEWKVSWALHVADQYRPTCAFGDDDERDEMAEALVVLADAVADLRKIGEQP